MRVVKILSSKSASNERKNTKNIITKNITKKDINNIIFVFLVIRLFNKITKLTIIYIIKKFINIYNKKIHFISILVSQIKPKISLSKL